MVNDLNVSVSQVNLVGLEQFRKKWCWFLGIGVLLVVLGATALGSVLTTTTVTMVTMVFIGWLMIAAGIAQTVHAFGTKDWGGFFIDLLGGVLYAVSGFLIVNHPAMAAESLTLFIALFLIFSGIFRICLAIAVRFPHWGWMLLHGVVGLLLGLSIWRSWPMSGLWVIGTFVGVDMIFNGWSLIMLGLAAKKLPTAKHA